MSYKFLKVTTYYPPVLEHFLKKYPEIDNFNFNEQLNLLLAEAFGWANFFQINLNQLGVDAYEIVFNADTIQNKWALENGIKNYSREEVFLKQLAKIKPEILYLQDTFSYSPAFIKQIREEIPSIKKIVGWLCSPYKIDDLNSLAACDLIFTCSELFLKKMGNDGLKCYRFNHAFESTLLPKIQKENNFYEVDFLFVGSVFPGSDLHDKRVMILERLLEEGIQMKIHTQIQKTPNLLIKQIAYRFYQFLKKYNLGRVYNIIPSAKRLAQYKEYPVDFDFSDNFYKSLDKNLLYGIEMLKAFSKSKLVFNSHGGVAGDYACNIRMFEATGAGSCLITDHKKNINEFFIPDEEVVTYKSIEECVEKVKWLLDNPVEIKTIAEAGHRRTLREHTFYNRCEEMDSIIRKELAL